MTNVPSTMIAAESGTKMGIQRTKAGEMRSSSTGSCSTGRSGVCVGSMRAFRGERRTYLIVFRKSMISARLFGSATPGTGMALPGIAFCGSARKASSAAASQVLPDLRIAGL
jgi:hypothetical protein